MITAEERERYFREALDALLERHGAEIGMDTDSRRTTVLMVSKWDDDGDLVADFAEFQL